MLARNVDPEFGQGARGCPATVCLPFYGGVRDGKHPSKHETLNQCWRNVGPASKTVAQHHANTGSTSRVN